MNGVNLFFPRLGLFYSHFAPNNQFKQQCRSEAIREVVADSEGVIEEEDHLVEGEVKLTLALPLLRAQFGPAKIDSSDRTRWLPTTELRASCPSAR